MKEAEIRNKEALAKYLELVAQDVKAIFDFSSFIKIDCPACGSADLSKAFDKCGFTYATCGRCETLFANPRPPLETLKEFYSRSSSTEYWIKDFFTPVAEARREKIFRPRAEYVCSEFGVEEGLTIGDIGAGFGLFLEELRKLRPNNRLIAIEPSETMADILDKKGLEVRRCFLEEMEDMRGGFDILTAFELAEHVVDPGLLLSQILEMLKPGGILYLTTLNSFGFDILMLGERSKAVFPPHHINFFNTASIGLLLESKGYEVRSVTTPGKLDYDIVEKASLEESVPVGSFFSHVIKRGSAGAKEGFQMWLSKNGFSSHMSVIARKPGPKR